MCVLSGVDGLWVYVAMVAVGAVVVLCVGAALMVLWWVGGGALWLQLRLPVRWMMVVGCTVGWERPLLAPLWRFLSELRLRLRLGCTSVV